MSKKRVTWNAENNCVSIKEATTMSKIGFNAIIFFLIIDFWLQIDQLVINNVVN